MGGRSWVHMVKLIHINFKKYMTADTPTWGSCVIVACGETVILVTVLSAGTEQVKDKRFFLPHGCRDFRLSWWRRGDGMGWFSLWCPEAKATLVRTSRQEAEARTRTRAVRSREGLVPVTTFYWWAPSPKDSAAVVARTRSNQLKSWHLAPYPHPAK